MGTVFQVPVGHDSFDQRQQFIPPLQPSGDGIEGHRLEIRGGGHRKAITQGLPEGGGDDQAAFGVNAAATASPQ